MRFANFRLVRYIFAMNFSRPLRLVILLLLLGGTVGCDQTTKHIARTKLNQFDSVMLLGGLGELQLAENSGAFLSLGDSLPQAIRTLVFTVVGGIGLLAMFVYLLHTTLLELLTGKTVGKMICRLRVVSSDGTPAGKLAILIRNLIRLIDVLLGPPLSMLILFSPLRQRLGDVLAGTTVIMDAPREAITEVADHAGEEQS